MLGSRASTVLRHEEDDGNDGVAERTYAWEGSLDMSWANVRMDEEGRLFSDAADQVCMYCMYPSIIHYHLSSISAR